MSFVYLIKAYNVKGDFSIVLSHLKTKSEVSGILENVDRMDIEASLGIEGPVLADRYPIGTIINEESEDEQ